jgi:acetylornithine/N-succinyldiaminopimelate aminotransferase
MKSGTHGSTFGGNPLAMAVANAVLDVVLEPGFLESVREKAILLRQHLAGLADRYPGLVEDIRGEGLLQGIKAKVTNTDLVAAMRKHRVLTVPAGDNVIRFAPPLTITADELREVFERCDTAFADFAQTQDGGAETTS